VIFAGGNGEPDAGFIEETRDRAAEVADDESSVPHSRST
jgi:hypothetical protein